MKAQKKKGIAAWIITSEPQGGPVRPPSDPIAVLNQRTPEKTVRLFVEMLYANTLSREDRIDYAKDAHLMPHLPRAHTERGLICMLGLNPSLEARKVRNLRVVDGQFKYDKIPRPL